MEIENTPLYREIQTIISKGVTTANVTWSAIVHYGNGQTLQPITLLSINTVRDYLDNYADVTTLTMVMGLGDYSRLIYPNRIGLEIELVKSDLLEGSDSIDPNGQIQRELYSAILIDKERSPTIAQGQEVNSQDDMNRWQLVDIDFQIYDKAIEQLRVLEVGGGFRSCTMENVVKTLLTTASQNPKVTAQRSIDGVDMIPADNTDVKAQVVIPHGVHSIDVPGFLQHRYGIYNSGIGSYIQNKNWFVYPLYDTSDFSTRHKSLVMMILPKRKFNNIERTYEVIGDVTTVLITGETGFKDDSGTNYLNAGNGARFTDATSLMDDPVTTSDNKVTIRRDDNNSEFTTGPGVGGINNVVTQTKRFTSNPFTAYSELAAKNGGMLRCVWQNSDATLIFPGMAVKVIYLDGNNVVEIYGIIHKSMSVSHKYSGYGNPRFKNQTIIDAFVNAQTSKIVA